MLGHGGSRKGDAEGICFGKDERGSTEQPWCPPAPVTPRSHQPAALARLLCRAAAFMGEPVKEINLQ